MPFGDIHYNPETNQAVGIVKGEPPSILKMKPSYRDHLPSTTRDLEMPASEFERLVAEAEILASGTLASPTLEMQRATNELRRILSQYSV